MDINELLKSALTTIVDPKRDGVWEVTSASARCARCNRRGYHCPPKIVYSLEPRRGGRVQLSLIVGKKLGDFLESLWEENALKGSPVGAKPIPVNNVGGYDPNGADRCIRSEEIDATKDSVAAVLRAFYDAYDAQLFDRALFGI